MGCVSSKIIRRTGSFRQELRNSLQRVGSLEEFIASSKNGGDQLLTLLQTANTVSRKLKAESPPRELESEATRDTPETRESESEVYKLPLDDEEEEVSQEKATDSEATDKEVELKEVETINAWELLAGTDKEVELKEVETINAWELLAGLEEEEKEEKKIHLQPLGDDGVARSRSFRTVEDFDAMVARDKPTETKEMKDSRRKSMAKELAALRVPDFEFGKSGSLRDWLLQGGQVFSPGSYVTPKFGGFAPPVAGEKDMVGFDFNGVPFDPEMVAQFEKTIEQLTVEEELIIEEILGSLGGSGGGGEGGSLSVSDDAVLLRK